MEIKRSKRRYKNALVAWLQVANKYGWKKVPRGTVKAHTKKYWRWIVPDNNPQLIFVNKGEKKSPAKKTKTKKRKNATILVNKKSKKKTKRKNPNKKSKLDRAFESAVIGLVPGFITSIVYHRKAKNPPKDIPNGLYEHKFSKNNEILLMKDGSLWIRPKGTKKKLWVFDSDLPK